jgi:Ca2+-binding RTX toxin-like protein
VVSGTANLSTAATSTSPVGSYPITVDQGTLSADNYTFAFVGGKMAVAPATLMITPAMGQSKLYGAAVPTLAYTSNGLVNNNPLSTITGALATSATAASPVGNYPITLGSLAAGSNYTVVLATNPATLAVTPAIVTITPTIGQSKVYGAAVPTLTYTPSGLVNNDPLSTITGALATTATAASPVGNYPITLGSLAAGNNYTVVLAANPPTFAVTPATLTVTANNATRACGQANPTFSVSYNGFVNGDTATTLSGTLSFSTPATTSSAAGTYAITPSGLTCRNYTITFVNGTLTILGPGVTLVGTQLFIVGGTSSNDQVQVSPVGSSTTGSSGVQVKATLNRVATTTTFTQVPITLQIVGYSGNDTFALAPSLTVSACISAGNGNDTVQGGDGATTVTLGDGNDSVQLGKGNNTVTLGNGNDAVQLGNGNNTVTLGNGNDSVLLGNGNNVVVTGNGHNSIQAGNGDNLIVAGLGQHTVQVGNGSNILIDGSVQLTQSGDSLAQVLSDWMAHGNSAANVSSIRSRLAVTYNTKNANTLSAGSGLDWFWATYSKDTTNRKATDLLS